jgi:hypothetical protein
VQPKLQRLERQRVAGGDDQLAVQQELALLHLAEHLEDLGKVAAERLAGPGRERHRLAVAAREAAEAVPFGFELPTIPLGQLGGEQGFHGNYGLSGLGHS